jgi:hypothetical protein
MSADYETTWTCLELMESRYYNQCMCGHNGDHNEDAKEDFEEYIKMLFDEDKYDEVYGIRPTSTA